MWPVLSPHAPTARAATAPEGSAKLRAATATAFRPALRSVSFCSCYVYSPRGTGYASEASRMLCMRLKAGDPKCLPAYAGQVRELAMRHEPLAGLFGREVMLVPVPGSAPSSAGVWAAERLAMALHGVGLGKSVWPGVQRRFGVRKSATALNADRPTVRQHHESFVVSPLPTAAGLSTPPSPIVLVDDVITRGRTILAAAARLHEAFPNADIRAFALVRTMGFLPNVTHSLEPCYGIVRWAGGDARREP